MLVFATRPDAFAGPQAEYTFAPLKVRLCNPVGIDNRAVENEALSESVIGDCNKQRGVRHARLCGLSADARRAVGAALRAALHSESGTQPPARECKRYQRVAHNRGGCCASEVRMRTCPGARLTAEQTHR